jgi:hypothetical protein
MSDNLSVHMYQVTNIILVAFRQKFVTFGAIQCEGFVQRFI